MRIGIVTFHCAYNFGSVLQAWALKHYLEQMGHLVSIVDYRGHDFDQYRLIQTRSAKSFAASLILYPRQRRRRDEFEAFIASEFALTARYDSGDELRMNDELPKQFDCFICGSDQIWNLDCTHGPVGPYFLSFAGDARRVAYAPSLSHTSFSEKYFGERAQDQLREWLSKFFAISVREVITAPIYQPFSNVPIDVCMDPTLLLSAPDYESLLRPIDEDGVFCPKGFNPKESIFVYMLEYNKNLVSYASNIAQIMNKRVVYVSKRPLRFEKVPTVNLYGIGPGEFLWLIQNCSAVLTNSFHATVFSLLFGTPFQTFTTSRSGSRMRELLNNLDLEDHLLEMESHNFETCFTPPQVLSMGKVIPLLVQERMHSLAFLEWALAE